MANELKKGDFITVQGGKAGTSAKGSYFLFRTGDKSNQITVWCNDGFSCLDGQMVQVTDILSVKIGQRKFNERWYPTHDVVCTLRLAGNAAAPHGEWKDITGSSDELPL